MTFTRLLCFSQLVILVAAFMALDAQAQKRMDFGEKPKIRIPRLHMSCDGLDRTYNLYVPASYSPKQATPLVVLLHGGGGVGRRMFTFTGFDEIADRTGAIIVAPDGVERHWNDGRKETGYKAHEENYDDVKFICTLVDDLRHEYKIDSHKIFAAGISNGAMMSFRLGLERPDLFAAIAPVVGSIPKTIAEKPWAAKSLPAVIVNGTGDPLVPYNGGTVKLMRRKLGEVISAPDAAAWWAKKNQCAGRPHSENLPDTDPSDGMKIELTEYKGSTPQQDVVLYTIEGGGHTWPGPRRGVQYLPSAIIGKACRKFDATDVIWKFFLSHPQQDNGKGSVNGKQ